MGNHYVKPFSVAQKLEVVRAVEQGLTQLEAARMFGMSPCCVSKWMSRYRKGGIAGLETPGGRPRAMVEGQVEAAGQLIDSVKKADPDAGVGKVQGTLFRHGFLDLARETVRRMLRRRGYGPIEGRTLRKNRPPKVKSFERANPNDLWQTDIMTFFIKGQYRAYLIGYMDDHSRLVVGWGLYRFQTQANVMEVFRAAIEKHGMPKEVLSDNGRQYYSWRGRSAFTQMLGKLGIRHVRSRPYHPQTCGKIESFWRNLLQECLTQTPYSTFEEARDKIAEYIEYYNFKRPHQGIGNLAPADRFYRVGEQVRQIVESNTAKVQEQAGERVAYNPPAYIVGNIGGKELRVVAKDAEVSLRDAGENAVESGGRDDGNSGGRDGEAVGKEAPEPAGADGPGVAGVGEGAEPGAALQPGRGVEGAGVPVDAPDAGCGAQGAGGEEAGAQAAGSGEGGGRPEAQGTPGGAREGSGAAAQGAGSSGAPGTDGSADHPAQGLGGAGD